MSKIRSWFFTGILVMTPAILTVYVAWAFITFVDNLIVPIVPKDYQPSNFLPFSIPGLGLIIVFIVSCRKRLVNNPIFISLILSG